ncbi:MAG: DUF4386 domain-containing protein, partial [Methanobrevibacter sp.]|nr:DUF4386 domain-containing protein [Methanobrevibacter sp.]
MQKGIEKRNYSKINGLSKNARIAGFMYLIFIITTIFADLFGNIGFGDAATIVNTIVSNSFLFQIGFISNLFTAVFFFLAAWFLYRILKPVNKNIALLFLLLNLSGVITQCIATLNLISAMTVLSGANYLQAIATDQIQAQAMLFIEIYKNGFNIAQIFYGAWVFPLGYLIFKSRFFPKILGILLMIDCFAILTYFLQFFIFPEYTLIAYPCYVI